jgi:hypothetical protein
MRSALGGAAAALGVAAASYAAYVATAWSRYGHVKPPADDERDVLLDTFMPRYDVVERHHVRVAASADVTFAAAIKVNLQDSIVIRAIFKAREVLLGAQPDRVGASRSLLEMTKRLGWVVLADVPGHEIVMGAVTRPWDANVVFRGIPSERFAAFNEPDYVKIVWTLRADAVDVRTSIARSETRAVATDESARRKFRWYWARFSPGIIVIREIAQRLIKTNAEARAGQSSRVMPRLAPGAER